MRRSRRGTGRGEGWGRFTLDQQAPPIWPLPSPWRSGSARGPLMLDDGAGRHPCVPWRPGYRGRLTSRVHATLSIRWVRACRLAARSMKRRFMRSSASADPS